ncbi:hypothetical protein Tco_0819032 [Tanacetum coccineum]|uniref:Uncharacterized protein n=1 Tax=Tanacetum coccineum TaxID=301880 RepID=A0ABQ5A6D0_9ASTR
MRCGCGGRDDEVEMNEDGEGGVGCWWQPWWRCWWRHGCGDMGDKTSNRSCAHQSFGTRPENSPEKFSGGGAG